MAKKKKRGQPKKRYDPQTGKIPKIREPENPGKLAPIWSFRLFDSRLKLPTGNAESAPFVQIIAKLRDFEGMTWNQLEGTYKQYHSVPINEFEKFARDRWAELRMEDLDELYRFSLKGKDRLWGMRDSQIFQVVWWDPEHEVCPAAKKHT